MLSKLFILISLTFSLSSSANYFVGYGGFSSFPLSTQDDVDGGTSILAFDPVLSFGMVIDSFWGQKFIPEIGYSMRLSEDDGYSKSTLFVLLDFAQPLNDSFVLRYGWGLFQTSVSGDGAAITILNGTGTAIAYRPSESSTASNATINVGIETEIRPQTTLHFETYIFEFLSSSKRDFSYTLSISYFL